MIQRVCFIFSERTILSRLFHIRPRSRTPAILIRIASYNKYFTNPHRRICATFKGERKKWTEARERERLYIVYGTRLK